MITIWTSGLEDQEKKDVRANFKESLVIRKRAITILEEKIESSRKNCLAKNTYDSPSWALVQADNIGYERAMRELINLFS